MKDEDRRRFESLETLRQAAYCSFNDRRVYEWKLNLAIWTTLAVLLAGLVQPSKEGATFPLRGTVAWVSVAILGTFVVILHAYWSEGAARANAIDKGVALHNARAMQQMLALPYEGDLKEMIEAHPKRVGWLQWSHLAQIAITALLVLATIVVVYVRS